MKRTSVSCIFFCFIIIALTAALFGGCATGRSKKEISGVVLIYASDGKVPSWITSIPEEKAYFYFVGTSGDSGSFDAGKKNSLNDALSQVVSTIGITVTASSTYEEKYFAEQYTTAISSELLSEGRAKLQDTEVTEIYYEQYENPDGSTFFRVWLLLKYSKSEIKREQERLAEILKMKYGELKNLEEKASDFTDKDMISDAVIAHLNAGIAALNILDGEVLFDRNMNRANELLLKLRFKKFGEEQVGYVGEPLEEPLRLMVYYLKDERDIPVPNVPVRFLYRIPKKKSAGYKYQAYNTVTDAGGLAEFKVDMVYEVSDANKVEAGVDYNTYVKQLQSVPSELQNRVKAFKSVQQKKKVTFIFKSDTQARKIRTAIYFIQIDADGRLLTKPVATPAVYEILYSKRFSIDELGISPSSVFEKSEEEVWARLTRSAGKGVKRILFGSVKIIKYDELSGFHTAVASAKATLYDKETTEVIRSWQVQRSATGSSKELAGINVLQEAGRTLGEIISNTMP